MSIVPVTVISGFHQVGKTSLLNHLLKSRPELRFGVILNHNQIPDNSAIDPSAHLEVLNMAEPPVEISGGCICCSLHEDLLREVARLAGNGRNDYLLIESSAFSEPLPIADMFSWVDEAGLSLSDVAQLDTLVTVVDAVTFLDDYLSMDDLQDRFPTADEDLDLSQLLAEQVEFANVIVLNKVDLVPEEHRGFLKSFLQHLNPEAQLLEAVQGEISSAQVLNTEAFQKGFSEQSAENSPGSPDVDDEENSIDSNYGVSTFSYMTHKPFHPERFYNFWMSNPLTEGIFRSRGCFWLATRCATAGIWSQAGNVISAQPGGTWWTETPREEWPEDDEAAMEEIQSHWDDKWGDRRQDLVLIGQDLDSDAITRALDECLLNSQEMAQSPESWQHLPDPFSSWDLEDDDASCEH